MNQRASNITICPTCKGWGYLDSFEGNICKDCQGNGVYIDAVSKRLVFGLPCFIDFSKRRVVRLRKIALVSVAFIVITIIILYLFIFVF